MQTSSKKYPFGLGLMVTTKARDLLMQTCVKKDNMTYTMYRELSTPSDGTAYLFIEGLIETEMKNGTTYIVPTVKGVSAVRNELRMYFDGRKSELQDAPHLSLCAMLPGNVYDNCIRYPRI